MTYQQPVRDPAAALDLTRPQTAATVGDDLVSSNEMLVRTIGASSITDLATLDLAVRDRQRLGDAIKRVRDYFAPLKGLAHQMHKALCDRESAVLGPLERLDGGIRASINTYKAAEDARRREAERVIEDRARQQREAEAAREAAALESMGDHDAATAVLDEAIAAPLPVVALPDATRTVTGLKFTRRWLWRYAGGPKDVKETPPVLVSRALATLPREFLKVDEQKLGAYARSMKESAKVQGIDFYCVDDATR